MKNIILFDDEHWHSMLPLSYTRPIAELRVGILTIREKWEKMIEADVSYITQDYLAGKFPFKLAEDNYIINSSVLPTPYILKHVLDLEMNSAIVWGETLIAARMDPPGFNALKQDESSENLNGTNIQSEEKDFYQLLRPHDIFRLNAAAIQLDFDLITKGRTSAKISEDNYVKGAENIFVEEGAVISGSMLNGSTGPIYIGKNAEIMEGAMIRGPFSMLDSSKVKMGAKIYGATTLGPHCKIGGEVKNTVFLGYGNKAHDGYLGDAVIGEWCNIGAASNNSNLKNNYSHVRLYDYRTERFEPTGLQFCGLIMGDHTKCGINTMFNTGTVIGVGANVFGTGYPRNFIPSFSWGGPSGFSSNKIEKMLVVVENVMKRRDLTLSDDERYILEHIYHYSARFRTWE